MANEEDDIIEAEVISSETYYPSFNENDGDQFVMDVLSAENRSEIFEKSPSGFLSNLKSLVLADTEIDKEERNKRGAKIDEMEKKVGELQGKKTISFSEEERANYDKQIKDCYTEEIDQIALKSGLSAVRQMQKTRDEKVDMNKWDWVKETKRFELSDEGINRIENLLGNKTASQQNQNAAVALPMSINNQNNRGANPPPNAPAPSPAPASNTGSTPASDKGSVPTSAGITPQEPDFGKDYHLSDDVKEKVDANNKGATLAAIIEAFANAKTPEDAFQAAFIAALLYLPNKLAWGMELGAAREKEKNEYIKREIESYDNLIASSKGLSEADRHYSVHKELYDACGDICKAAAKLKEEHPELLDDLGLSFNSKGKVVGNVSDKQKEIIRSRILQQGYFDTYGHMPTADKLRDLQKESITLQKAGMYAKGHPSQVNTVAQQPEQSVPAPKSAPAPVQMPRKPVAALNPARQPVALLPAAPSDTNVKEMSLKDGVEANLTIKPKDLRMEYKDYINSRTAYQSQAQAVNKNRDVLNNLKNPVNLTVKNEEYNRSVNQNANSR